MWPNVLDQVKDYRRVTWAQLFEKSDVLGVDDKQLQIGLRDVGAHRAFSQGGHDEIVRQALIDVVGLDLAVVAVLDPSVAGSGAAPEPAKSGPTSSEADQLGCPPGRSGRGPSRRGGRRSAQSSARSDPPTSTTTRSRSTTRTPTTTVWPGLS